MEKKVEFLEGRPILEASNHNELKEAVQKFSSDYPDIPLTKLYVVRVNDEHLEFDAFKDADEIGVVILSDSVTEIGYSAFDGCTGLTDIVISDSIKEIGLFAFDDCNNLREIHIKDDALLEGTNISSNVKIISS